MTIARERIVDAAKALIRNILMVDEMADLVSRNVWF